MLEAVDGMALGASYPAGAAMPFNLDSPGSLMHCECMQYESALEVEMLAENPVQQQQYQTQCMHCRRSRQGYWC